jgi:cystathionine beta-synthase
MEKKMFYQNILETIGKTPLVEVTRFETGPCRLFLKLENQNPGGSIKDRIALSMIHAAEAEGRLKPGGTIIEATAGNTGLGLALVARMKGYNIMLVIPDKMSQEKINHLKALGAEIMITRSDVGKGHPEYYQDMAACIARERGAFYANQFENPANPLAHETTTGPEIWEQMEHDIDAVVVGVGSSGTMTGLTHFFKRVSTKVEMILADPAGSVLSEYVQTGRISSEAGSWLVEGIGEDFIPPIADFSLTKKAYVVTDQDSIDTVRELLKREGILAGSSTGTLLCAALRYCRGQTTPKRVVTFVCDSGSKYLSKMYNDFWLHDQGLGRRKKYGDLRDIIARRFEDHATIFVNQDDTLNKTYGLMKMYGVSQIPVLKMKEVVGIVDESDLLLVLSSHTYAMTDTVSAMMTRDLKTFRPGDAIESLVPVLNGGLVAIIEDEEKTFQGLITKIDLINYLRNGR